MTIYVDTREQKPIGLPNTVSRTLNVGDYTTPLLLKSFAIERKNPIDLYQTLTRNHETFKREMGRAEAAGITIVVFVERPLQSIIKKTFPGAGYIQTPGEVLGKIINTMSLRYNLEFVWCRNRLDMRDKIFARLKKEERKLKTL